MDFFRRVERMEKRRKRRPLPWRGALSVLGAGIFFLIAGCADTGVRGVLHLGMEDAPEGKRLYWPSPPEVPRYMYAGALIGEANFKKEGEEARKGARGFFNWLVGLFEAKPQPVVLQRPQSGTVDEEGRIYVTDVSRQAVFVFDEKAGELLVWDKAQGAKNFMAPVGIAMGRGGGVLVADAELGMVVRLDRQGNPIGSIGKGVLKRPTGLARDAKAGLIFVADTYGHDVKVFDDEGRLVNVIGHRGEGNGEFNFPTFLAFAGGELYVTDTMNNRIQVFAADGEVLNRKFGSRGLYLGNMVRPKGVAVDNEGDIYVVESYYDHLLVYNNSGELLLPIGGAGQETGSFYLPSGVWIDSRNRVFVADTFNGRIVIFQFLGGG